jgi:hypothetical protein
VDVKVKELPGSNQLAEASGDANDTGALRESQ